MNRCDAYDEVVGTVEAPSMSGLSLVQFLAADAAGRLLSRKRMDSFPSKRRCRVMSARPHRPADRRSLDVLLWEEVYEMVNRRSVVTLAGLGAPLLVTLAVLQAEGRDDGQPPAVSYAWR